MKLQGWKRGMIVTATLFTLLLVQAFVFIGQVERKTEEDRLQWVKEAVECAAVTCYAVEGRYPEEVSYLVSNYGLVYDFSRYLIRYEAFAANVLPDIAVFVRGTPK